MTGSLHFLCRREDLAPGEMRAFEVGRVGVVLCRYGDSFAALRDVCPHHRAKLSEGVLGGTNTSSGVGDYQFVRPGEIIRCPRHGYEYDICTGRSLHDPSGMRVRSYRVVEQDGGVYIEV